jgi:hypothetical protein
MLGMTSPTPKTLATARRSTSVRLRGLELPEAFASATVAAEAHALTRDNARPADIRRAAAKARKVDSLPARAILLGGFHGGGR